MERWVLVTVIIGIYLVANLVIGLMAGRRASKSVTGFVAADRSFGLLVMYFVTGATVFSSFAFLGGPGWAYSRGAAAFYILAYGVLGMAPFYWVGPRIAELGRRLGHVTQAQLITGRFPSRRLSALIALISLVAFIPYVTLQIEGAGLVILRARRPPGLRHRHPVRPRVRRRGGGMDEHVPGDLHGDHRLGAGHLPAHPPLRRRGRHVRAHRHRPAGAPDSPGADRRR